MPLTSPQRRAGSGVGGKVPAYADPSAKEMESMAKMRAWLSRDGLAVPYTMTNEAAGGETRALLKFIRARPKSAEKAYEMLKNTL